LSLQYTLERVQGRLRSGLQNARHRWRTRSGLLVRLRDAEGFEGVGEASPLLGYSPDSLPEAEGWLRQWLAAHSGEALTALPVVHEPAPPSAVFALETACLNLLAAKRQQPAWRVLAAELGRTEAEVVRVNGLITALDPDVAVVQARLLVLQGVVDIKLKVGRPEAFEVECAAIEAVQAVLPEQGRVRVDANQAFAAEALSARLDTLAELGVALVEEPAPTPALLALDATPVSLLLDETLHTPSGLGPAQALVRRGLASGWVLKPAVLGGLRRAAALAEQATQLGATVSVSHLMDGGIAHGAYAALAVVVGGGPHGLAAHAGLEALGLHGAWPVTQGALHPDAAAMQAEP